MLEAPQPILNIDLSARYRRLIVTPFSMLENVQKDNHGSFRLTARFGVLPWPLAKTPRLPTDSLEIRKLFDAFSPKINESLEIQIWSCFILPMGKWFRQG